MSTQKAKVSLLYIFMLLLLRERWYYVDIIRTSIKRSYYYHWALEGGPSAQWYCNQVRFGVCKNTCQLLHCNTFLFKWPWNKCEVLIQIYWKTYKSWPFLAWEKRNRLTKFEDENFDTIVFPYISRYIQESCQIHFY